MLLTFYGYQASWYKRHGFPFWGRVGKQEVDTFATGRLEGQDFLVW